MFTRVTAFFTAPGAVAAELEKVNKQLDRITTAIKMLSDNQAAMLSAMTARMDSLANRLGNVEHHTEALRGSNSKSEGR